MKPFLFLFIIGLTACGTNKKNLATEQKDSVQQVTAPAIQIDNTDTVYMVTPLSLDSIDLGNMPYYLNHGKFGLKNGVYDESLHWKDCRTLYMINISGIRNPSLVGWDSRIVELMYCENACVASCNLVNYILVFKKKGDQLMLTSKLSYHQMRPASWQVDKDPVIFAWNSERNDSNHKNIKIWTDLCVLAVKDGDLSIEQSVKIDEQVLQ